MHKFLLFHTQNKFYLKTAENSIFKSCKFVPILHAEKMRTLLFLLNKKTEVMAPLEVLSYMSLKETAKSTKTSANIHQTIQYHTPEDSLFIYSHIYIYFFFI